MNPQSSIPSFWKFVVALSIVVMAGLAAGCSKEPAEKEPIAAVHTAGVQKAPISEVVTTEAVLYPLNQAALAAKITAPVKTFFVNRGDHVRRGQLLAVLENKDLRASAVESKGTYEQAQANLDIAAGATVPEEVQKAELDVKTAKHALDAQQKVYDSRKVLFDQGALPRKDLDSAFVTLAQLRAQYEIAEKHLLSLQNVSQKQELKAATGQMTSAQGRYQAAEALLSYSEIRSPLNGVVTDRPVYPGDTVTAGTPFMTVMDVSQVIAKAHISESAAAILKKGDAATMKVPGLDHDIAAKVVLVSPALDPNSTTVEVWAEASNPKGELKPGTTIQLSMVAQTVPDALVIPGSALLQTPGGGSFVLVVGADGRAHERTVTTGIRNADSVQVLSGLRLGEEVISSGNYGLPDKTKVRVEKLDPETGAK